MTMLMYIIYFIILIGVLVFVHEGGHFTMAKLFKVKVHAFSLGFGPRLIGFTKGETQYKICAVPIGGYVKMLGEDPSEEIGPEDKGRAFTDKPLWQRFLIIIGGPVMNLIFPLFIHFGAGLAMTEVPRAEIGIIMPDSPAEAAGLLPGDRVVSINGQPIDTYKDLLKTVHPQPGVPLIFEIARGDKTFKKTITPATTEIPFLLTEKQTVGLIGVENRYLAAVVGIEDPMSPAGKAGLISHDMVTAINNEAVERLVDMEKRLLEFAGKTVNLTVKRLKKLSTPPYPSDLYEDNLLTLALLVPESAKSLKDLGISDSRNFVARLDPTGAGAKAGLSLGDRLIAYDGKKYLAGKIYAAINKDPEKTHQLTYSHQGTLITRAFKPKFLPEKQASKELGITRDVFDKGFGGLTKKLPGTHIENPSLIASAVENAFDETWYGVRMIGIGFKLMFKGEVSMRSIGGPIMIGQLAGMAGSDGARSFFWMMALISLNLGLLNLLPIPVLDGGHIVFIGIEAITRRPVSPQIKEKVMLVGLAMLLMLMVFATWNDISRLIVS